MKKLLLSLLALFSLSVQAALTVRIPLPEPAPPLYPYYRQLLTLALEKSGEDFAIDQVALNEPQQRLAQRLLEGKTVNLLWMGTSGEYEQTLLPVLIPLLRGLSGFRLLLINQTRQQDFSRVQSLGELATFIGVQGIGWSDIDILKQAGLNISAAPRDTILDMLNRNQHVDYYPRSLVEAHAELAATTGHYPLLMAEPRLLLHYPFAIYFFVSPEYPELAEALKRGLTLAYTDGSFMTLFEQYPPIRASLPVLQQPRLRLELANPFMNESSRRVPAQYWHPAARP
ncbi:hypothetical protein [Oceanisphaera sp. KMM 10153]|uniref:hypothetical protein n=1 Tax=Oceanisphaera submarina TaxID=3390193 RepID=UPI003976D4B6